MKIVNHHSARQRGRAHQWVNQNGPSDSRGEMAEENTGEMAEENTTEEQKMYQEEESFNGTLGNWNEALDYIQVEDELQDPLNVNDDHEWTERMLYSTRKQAPRSFGWSNQSETPDGKTQIMMKSTSSQCRTLSTGNEERHMKYFQSRSPSLLLLIQIVKMYRDSISNSLRHGQCGRQCRRARGRARSGAPRHHTIAIVQRRK